MTRTPRNDGGRWWRHIPNAISGARLAATPVLLYFDATRYREAFTWLLLACLLSDIADGLIARAFNLRTTLGAVIDSVADMLVFVLAVAGLFVFHMPFLRTYGPLLSVPLALYAVEVGCALARYGRISSFHTVLVRVAAYVQGIFIMALFLWGPSPWLVYVSVTTSTVAYLEELLLIAMLPDWTADVRGIYWLINSRRAAVAS